MEVTATNHLIQSVDYRIKASRWEPVSDPKVNVVDQNPTNQTNNSVWNTQRQQKTQKTHFLCQKTIVMIEIMISYRSINCVMMAVLVPLDLNKLYHFINKDQAYLLVWNF